jgi:two-component system, NtrC family, sensor kinase
MKSTKYKSKRFLFQILSLVLISIVSISFLNLYITVNMFKSHMEEHIEQTKKEYTNKNKTKVQEEVNFVNDSINFEISRIEEELKLSLKEKILNALNIASYTYNTYKHTHNKEEIKEKISKALEVINYDGKRNYYFMYDNKTKILFGHPMKDFKGKDMTNFRDIKGQSLMQLDAEALKKDDIAYNKIYFNKPDNQEEEFPKITCITKFKPLDLVLGIGEYLDVVETESKEYVLKKFSQINFNKKDKYIVILDVHNLEGGDEFATVLLNSNRHDLVGKKVSDKEKDMKGNRFRKNFLNLIKEKGEGFSSYWYKKPSTDTLALKVSYISYQKDWNWLILSGYYYEDLEKQISNMKESISNHTNKTINKTILWILLLSLIIVIIAILVSYLIDNTIKKYTLTIIEYEDNKREQEHLLIQQSKMAAMGEMLGNIAHQWRQPLSTITVASTGAKLQKEMGCLTDKELNSVFTSINNAAQYLSTTIDDFRDFFNLNNSKITRFNISDTFNKTLSLVRAQYTAKNIEIIENIENIELSLIENELIQVLINILNNARDALLNIKNQPRLIFIDVFKKDDEILIEIKDNAQGVPEDIIDKIFEPYFTTKHKSQGTGIGLFMSEEIVRKHLKGTIRVSNENYTYEGVTYKGAKFSIVFDLN